MLAFVHVLERRRSVFFVSAVQRDSALMSPHEEQSDVAPAGLPPPRRATCLPAGEPRHRRPQIAAAAELTRCRSSRRAASSHDGDQGRGYGEITSRPRAILSQSPPTEMLVGKSQHAVPAEREQDLAEVAFAQRL